MRRLLAVLVPAILLSACSHPVFVPEAGPNAPGFSYQPPPPPPPSPPRVEVLSAPPRRTPPAAGAVDSVVQDGDSLEISGWAMLGSTSRHRGALRLVLPQGVDARVEKVINVERSDVVEATGDEANRWAGFTVTLRGTLPGQTDVCVLSRSPLGNFTLAGSSDTLCPS